MSQPMESLGIPEKECERGEKGGARLPHNLQESSKEKRD